MIKAVIVGINRYPDSPLQGCVNDATDLFDYLTGALSVPSDSICALYDDAATKRAIVLALRDMIAHSNPGDHLLFHYSGHGSQLPVLGTPTSQSGAIGAPEPDGLEEILCPVDFSWDDPSTALTDNELRQLLDMVAHDRCMTVTLDSCHSGDSIRKLQREQGRARWLRPPPDVQQLLRAARRNVERARHGDAPPNISLVSACRSTETAADTSFDGRPNGAFTYYWLNELKTHAASLEATVAAVTKPLARFGMHPTLDGSEILAKLSFLSPGPRSDEEGQSAVGLEPTQLLFDERWIAKLFDVDVEVGLQIAVVRDAYEFQLSWLSGWPLRRAFAIRQDASETMDIGSGYALVLSVSDWTSVDRKVGFDLAISVKVPFFRAIAVTEQHVMLSELRQTCHEPLDSADLLAKARRAERLHQSFRAGAELRDGDSQFTGVAHIETFVGGLFGARYNRIVNAYVPPGFVRSHVEVSLDAPDSGNVYFVQWEDSDPHIGRFQFHVGCPVFGGGVATFYMHCVRERTANRDLPSFPTDGLVLQAVRDCTLGSLGLQNY